MPCPPCFLFYYFVFNSIINYLLICYYERVIGSPNLPPPIFKCTILLVLASHYLVLASHSPQRSTLPTSRFFSLFFNCTKPYSCYIPTGSTFFLIVQNLYFLVHPHVTPQTVFFLNCTIPSILGCGLSLPHF